jgi:outer membrane lipoprotein SlyB
VEDAGLCLADEAGADEQMVGIVGGGAFDAFLGSLIGRPEVSQSVATVDLRLP